VNKTQLVVRAADERDGLLLAELLAGLSPASAFHRFLAGLGCPTAGLVRGLLRTAPGRGALLAVEASSCGRTAVGHACWTVDDGGVADIGVVVADGTQGRGVGGRLFDAALLAAQAAGAVAVHLDVHPDNRRVAAILRGWFGPRALAWEQGLLTLDAPLADVVRQRPTHAGAGSRDGGAVGTPRVVAVA
jgi:ribosomal protein S18 acetylase RimI-like enzyme